MIVLTALFKSIFPDRISDRPLIFFCLKSLCVYPLRISVSINNTFFPVWAITAARFELTKVFPAFGLAPEIISTLLRDSIIAKCKLVRSPLIASIARSAGFSTAKNDENSSFEFFNHPLSFALLFATLSATGMLAYTLIPISSSCSGVSNPLRRNTLTNTSPAENIAPNTMPTSTINIFFGFTGFG